MAGVSTKEIKTRIKSMESTKQITKAMEMVASSKLRKAQNQVLTARPYFEVLQKTIDDIAGCDQDFTSAYIRPRPVKKRCYVVFAGDRGLAGGYNSNMFKTVMAQLGDEAVTVLPIGRRCVEYFTAHGVEVLTVNYAQAEAVTLGDCFSIAKNLCKQFLKEEFDEVWVAYTDFVSVLSQVPVIKKLLPVTPGKSSGGSEMVYEPDGETVFTAIIPEFLGGVLYGALCESRASEQAARRTAMDNATQNAEEMIANLSLQYNRARHAAITQEITEIVAGSQ